jgi:hypothetical protein
MTKKPKPGSKPKAKPGPKADTLRIKGSWKRAIRKSFEKEKPPEGWPK